MKMRVDNPFVVGKYAGSEYFCDRVKETEMLRHQLVNGRDVALISPRRMGKTGLIQHLFEQEDIKERFNPFFVDIYGASSFEEMVYLMGKAIFESLKPKKKIFAERFFQIVQSLRVGLKIDQQSGMPTFDLGIGDIKSPTTTLDEIFEYLSSTDKPCIVAIDEFQKILSFDEKNVEAMLRTKIQHCPNVRWIFAGSQRHLLMAMFNTSSRPFYQSVMIYSLLPIPMEEYDRFCHRMFHNRGRRLEEGTPQEVYNKFGACTWFMQMQMNELFAMTPPDAECKKEWIEGATANILDVNADSYRATLSMLSTKQKAVLQAVAKEGEAQGVTSAAFVDRWSLGSASSVQSSLRRLLSLDLVTENENKYRLTDYFFSLWLSTNY